MKNRFAIAVFALAAVLFCGTSIRAEQLMGKIGSAVGADWQSSWMDLSTMTTFKTGEKLIITTHGSAENIVVRLLPQGAHPTSSEGIIGSIIRVPKDGILRIELKETHKNVVQISIHGGQKAWDFSLGDKNGPVNLVSIERSFR